MPYEDVSGIGVGSMVVNMHEPLLVGVGPELLGKAILDYLQNRPLFQVAQKLSLLGVCQRKILRRNMHEVDRMQASTMSV